jgi:hypothetical protein
MGASATAMIICKHILANRIARSRTRYALPADAVSEVVSEATSLFVDCPGTLTLTTSLLAHLPLRGSSRDSPTSLQEPSPITDSISWVQGASFSFGVPCSIRREKISASDSVSTTVGNAGSAVRLSLVGHRQTGRGVVLSDDRNKFNWLTRREKVPEREPHTIQPQNFMLMIV